ncbi:MAG: glutathione peroxidase [Prevotella sp.]|nr:glutathione peroxidase [Prevotella sp.]
MKRILMLLMLAVAIGASAQKNIYKFKVKDADGKKVSLAQYKGKVLLVVNTATQCGFTPQYADLEALYSKYKDQGFVILDFPCNQFGQQAPGTAKEIHAFCTGKYDIHFPQFDKVDVNGKKASPLFVYLKQQQGFKGFGEGATAIRMGQMLAKRDASYAANADIKWNFTKFLIDRTGKVVARFEPTHQMSDVELAVAQLLK